MDESFYHKEADIMLNKLLEYTEALEEAHDIESELESGVLTITLPSKKQYVINKHTPSRQIWVSSPLSGAAYYELAEDKWQAKRVTQGEKQELMTFLEQEIRQLLI